MHLFLASVLQSSMGNEGTKQRSYHQNKLEPKEERGTRFLLR